ncbi:hypothetical protein ABEB36_008099 [Hypothenemus hampei]
MQRSFYMEEVICQAYNMHNQPESFPEMDFLLVRAALDGVSVVAIDKESGKVAGAAFNKLEEPEQGNFLTYYEKICQNFASKSVTRWMWQIEKLFTMANKKNIFEFCNVNCVMELMFLGVLPEFRKRGIAKKLCEVSICLAKDLYRGLNVKTPIDDDLLQSGCPPQAVTGIFTSPVTQKIARDLQFSNAAKFEYHINNNDIQFRGDSIGVSYDYLKLR